MKKLIWLVIIVLVVWFGYKALSNKSVAPTAGETVKIGFVGPLSGDASALGQQMQNVVAYRIAEINAAAGEAGTKFEVVYEDGKCAGAAAANAFQKLTEVGGVKIILGGACSAETLGMAPLAGEKKIVLSSAVSSNPTIEDQNPYVFSFSYSDKKNAEDMVKAVSAFKKVALLTEQTDFSIGLRDGVVELLKQYPSVTLVANETFPKSATDFRAVLEKIKNTAPDALILNPNVGVTAENLLKQLAEMKTWKGYGLFGFFPYLQDTTRAAVGTFAEGMSIIDAPTVNSTEFLAAFNKIEAAKGTLKDLGNFYTASLLDDVNVLTAVIAAVGNDPEKVQAELSTGSWQGYIGAIRFDGNNFVRFNLTGKYVIKDGKAVLQ